MKSKILIDVDVQGMPTLKIINPYSASQKMDDPLTDVRDKLVARFLSVGAFAIITHNETVVDIHSLSVIDLLSNIDDLYSQLYEDNKQLGDFKQAIINLSDSLKKVGCK